MRTIKLKMTRLLNLKKLSYTKWNNDFYTHKALKLDYG